MGDGVVGNSNDYILGSDATPYIISYEHTTGGTLRGHYEPTTMIIGDTLPDRQGGDNPGTFTWGSNPAGVSVSFGSMTSSGQPSIGGIAEDETRDLLPPGETSDWYGDGTVSGTILTNPIRPFVTMISDNTEISELQAWRLLGLAVWLFATVWVATRARGHQGITAMVSGAVIGGMVAFDNNVFPFYLVVLAIGLFVGGIVAERSPSI